MSAKPRLATLLFLGICLFSTARPVPAPTPFKAFCKVVWLVGIPCDEVSKAIVSQIEALDQYQLRVVTPDSIEANHISPGGPQVDNLTFAMMSIEGAMGCHVGGLSMSQFWFSRLDNNTNYCNLYNVIQGSGLSATLGFTEYTNDWICLGFGLGCKA